MSAADADRYVMGMAIAFDEPDRHGKTWTAEMFRAWVATNLGCDMLNGHREPIAGLNEAPLGWWSRFAIYPGDGGVPPGLLCLGTVNSEYLLEEIRRSLPPFPHTGPYGLSVAAVPMHGPNEPEWYYLGHVGLTRNPAVELARVGATGEKALSAWELLTGETVRA